MAAPPRSELNLCIIHFHANAEHRGGEFTPMTAPVMAMVLERIIATTAHLRLRSQAPLQPLSAEENMKISDQEARWRFIT